MVGLVEQIKPQEYALLKIMTLISIGCHLIALRQFSMTVTPSGSLYLFITYLVLIITFLISRLCWMMTLGKPHLKAKENNTLR